MAVYIFAIRDRFEKQARMSFRGMKGDEARRVAAQVVWAKGMVSCVDYILKALVETLDAGDVERARQAYLLGLPEVPSKVY